MNGVVLAAAASLACMTAAGAALAHDGRHEPGDPLYDACIENSDGTNADWAKCGGEMIARADARLNAVWKRVYGAMDGEAKSELLAAQRAWIAYNEKACGFYMTPVLGREGQVLGYPACKARVIEERTRLLESFVCDTEGDVTCIYAPPAGAE